MILNKEIEVTINPSNFNRFKKLGYCFNKVGDKVLIKIEHLSKGSHLKIDVLCEYCNKIKQISYCNYLQQCNKGDKKYYCIDCKNEKAKKTLIKKYNVDNISKLNFIKQKKIDTTIKNYGVEYTFQSDVNKNKRMISLFEKYGVYHNSQLESYKKMRLIGALEYDIEYRKYRNNVRRITRNNKFKLLESWNGYDYYDNEFIKDNFKLKYTDSLYPSIDHKISVINGYINNISDEIIGHIDNLCITKRKINSSKNKKTEIEFIQKNNLFIK